MADERIFSIKINGVEESYKNAQRLVDVLNMIEDVTKKVVVETNKETASIQSNTKAKKEKNQALTDEEKLQKKIADAREKANKPISDEEKELIKANLQLKERTKTLNNLVKLEQAAKNSPAEFKAELALLNQEWDKVSEGTKEFEELTEKINNLTSRLKEAEAVKGTFTRNVGNYPEEIRIVNESFENLGNGIHKTTESTKGMLSVFQAGVGIALLFDDSNDELSKALNSLGKTMAIVGAIQSANNTLIKSGTLLQKSRVVVDLLVTKGIISQTAAQTALNIATKAFPLLFLLAGIGAVVGALVSWVSGNDKTRESQSRLNEVVNDSIKLKDEYAEHLKKTSDTNIKKLERELSLMKARGDSDSQLQQKQQQILDQRLKAAKSMNAYYSDEVKNIDKNSKGVEKYIKLIDQLDRDYHKAIKNGEKSNADEYKKKREELENYLNIFKLRLDQGLRAVEIEKQVLSDIDNFNAENQKKNIDLGKKNALALAEYRVLMAQKGSKEELTAQIALANQRLKNDLNNTDITNGERKKRTKETLLEIEKLESDFRKNQYQDTIDLINSRLSLVKKGTLEEFSLQSALLDEQRKIDLENKELTAEKRKLIDQKYFKDLEDLGKNFDAHRTEVEISTNISILNARLSSVKVGSDKELEIRIELAKETARLAEENVKNSIEDEELKAAKIKEINESLQKELRDINLENDLSKNSSQTDKETLRLTKQLEERKIKQYAYEKEILKLSLNSLQQEITTRKKYGQDTTDLEIELSGTRIELAEKEKNEVLAHFEQLHAQTQKIVDGIMTGVNAVFGAVSSIMQSQLDDANEKFDAISEKYDKVVEKREESDSRLQELEEKSKNAQGARKLTLLRQIDDEMIANTELANQEKQLARDKEKLEKDIAKKEKQQKKVDLSQKLIQGIANTALGVTEALGSSPPPFNFILASLVGAAGAVETSLIAKQISKLEDGGLLNGKKHSQGGMRIEGTNIEVEGGEYVVNRESTAKNIGLIRYINTQRRELTPNDISGYFSTGINRYEPPFKRMFETGGQLPNIENNVTIDNDALIEAIESIHIEPRVSVTDINTVQNEIVSIDDWTDL